MRRGPHNSSGDMHPLVDGKAALAALVPNLPASVVVYDAAGQLVWMNQAGNEAMGALMQRADEASIARSFGEIHEWMTGLRTFPAEREFTIGNPIVNAITLGVNRIGDGYLAVIHDTTLAAQTTAAVEAAAASARDAAGAVAALGKQLDMSAATTSSEAAALASSSEELTLSVSEIAASATAAAASTTSAVASAQAGLDSMETLSQASDKIGSITALISGIASQTNLLALNATIEAARAGASGRGFEIVASEVKDLARRTSDATQDIAAMVESIQTHTDSARSRIGDIVGMIEVMREQQSTIASAVEEQSAMASELGSRVAAIAQATAATAEVTSDMGLLSARMLAGESG